MKNLVIALIIAITASANADSLYTGGWSEHINPVMVTNETHYLLAYEREGYIVGGFKNSFGDPTALAAKRFESEKANRFLGEYNLKAGLYVGATYGYYGCDSGGGEKATVCAAVVPEISYTKYRIQPTFVLLGNAVAFTIKWDLE